MLKIETLEKMMNDSNWRVRAIALRVCKDRRDVPIDLIEKGLHDVDCDVRTSAMRACIGRDVPIEWIERGLLDDALTVRDAAMKACEGRYVPIELIAKWLHDLNWRVRVAAMKACEGRDDVPIDLIDNGLRDSDSDVRDAAMKACEGRDVPLRRTFEPPKKVYKNCVGCVIVVAHIPKDAHVRGSEGDKCRASKAEIVDIIGDLYGERVGVSYYDSTVEYHIGDVVEIKNFDFSDVTCSSGFHFFCTLDEAKNFEF